MSRRKRELDRKEHGLRASILAHMIFFPFIPFLLVMGTSFYFFSSTLETKTRTGLQRTLTDHSQMIDSFLKGRMADIELITRAYTYDQLSRADAIHEVYQNLARRSPAFVDLGLFDASGLHLKYSGNYPLIGKSYAGEEWFQRAMERGFYISDVFLGFRNVPHFVIAVRKKEPGRAWVIRATIDTLFFNALVNEVRIGKTGEAYILNHAGVAQTPRRSGNIRLLDTDPDHLKIAKPDLPSRTPAYLSLDKGPFLYAVARLSAKPWLVVVRQERRDAFAALYSAMVISLVILVCGVAVLVITAFFTTERISRRITELVREKETLGNQLVRAVQLAEIGEMAAGFAHEINNPLQIVKSEYALIKILISDLSAKTGRSDAFREIRDSLEQIRGQVDRCTRITRAILKFGRNAETDLAPLDPAKAIPEVLDLVAQKAKVSGIAMETVISDTPPGFMGNQSRFQQVLLNLLNNAMDAVAERHGGHGGHIKITAAKDGDGGRLKIQVHDNGVGIHPEHMEKIFSPFFTTKAVGRGTGLGLSVCFGIIEEFGGTMHANSRLDRGTVFTICLPALYPSPQGSTIGEES